jgi:hypothetical protein
MNRPLLGKSFIALTLFKRLKMPVCNVLWMCEQEEVRRSVIDGKYCINLQRCVKLGCFVIKKKKY